MYRLAQAQTSVVLQKCRPFSFFFIHLKCCLLFCSTESYFVNCYFPEAIRANFAYDKEIIIQVSNNALHQMSSRVFGTLVREILNYKVVYTNVKFSKNELEITEKEKLYDTLQQIIM